MTEIFTSSKGLKLDAPTVGDIVTVRIKRRPKHETLNPSPLALLTGTNHDEADSPQHYRINNLWKVLAVNGGQAVVKCLSDGYYNKRKEIWSISHHEWFEAGDLFEIFKENSEESPVK